MSNIPSADELSETFFNVVLPFLFIVIGVVSQVWELIEKKSKAREERESRKREVSEMQFPTQKTATPKSADPEMREPENLRNLWEMLQHPVEATPEPVKKVQLKPPQIKPQPIAAKKTRTEPPQQTETKIVKPSAENSANQIRTAMNVRFEMPAMSLPQNSSGGTGSAMLQKLGLKDRAELRRALLSYEILGKPKGLE